MQGDLVRFLKTGFRSSSSSSSYFSSRFRISIASILGFAGLVFALRDRKFAWLLRAEKSAQKLKLVPGLLNLGNNCFLNVVLQALASCSGFQSFVQRVVDECESLSLDESSFDNLPLAVALCNLLEELCVVGEGRMVLSPRRVMLSMVHYIPSFNLTAQQDAAEAFLHIISSLREEFAGCYDPNPRSLLDLCSSSCRIIGPKRDEDQSEPERWQKSYIGPFDGILVSVLNCQSCSSQISMNFEAFHSLPLSPVSDLGSPIIPGCSLEVCLKQFTVAEEVENYHCTNCWHNAVIKYLTCIGANERDIEKVQACTKQDFCECQITYHHGIFPWSNKFSHTFKQISIARSPKILCIQLKRVSVNMFGELAKLQGHISFPLIMDLSPFMTNKVAIRTQKVKVQQHHRKPFETRNLVTDEQDLRVKSYFHQTRGTDTETTCIDNSETQSDEQDKRVSVNSEIVSSNCLYRLVSVVEHFGRAGSGHYTVYRSTRDRSCENELVDSVDDWFCISDSEVYRVSESEVLCAEASLLFYERISES